VTPPVTPLVVDTTAVSEMTGIPAETLKYYRRAGKGPRWARIGKRVVYRPRDVEAWIDSMYPAIPAVSA
jgi:DNA-binding transcriptional MerR regulator